MPVLDCEKCGTAFVRVPGLQERRGDLCDQCYIAHLESNLGISTQESEADDGD